MLNFLHVRSPVDKDISSTQAYVNNLKFLRRFKIICMDTTQVFCPKQIMRNHVASEQDAEKSICIHGEFLA
jgi:hypothetical protein